MKSCMSPTFNLRLAQSTVDLGPPIPHLEHYVPNLGFEMDVDAILALW